MDQQTVTLLFIAVSILTVLLIAAHLGLPRLGGRDEAGPVTRPAADTTPAAGPPAVAAHVPAPPPAARDDPETPDGPRGLGQPDPVTGLLTASGWGTVVADEDARVRRYRRPATVVMVEIDGLDRLTERLGPGVADRLVPGVSAIVRRLAREADQVAQLGPSRFGVLLPETDEIQAINYVERIRGASDEWLASGAVSLRLAVGWTSAAGDDTLHDAVRIATERMFAEIHGNARDAGVPGPASR
jgi:diguanylate cyclase (GGDEF)-like protein